jgi:quinohemoprotein ethanol dehydrogenase
MRARDALRCVILLLALFSLGVAGATAAPSASSVSRYLDSSDGADWPGYGRTFGEQHYSPLAQVNQSSIQRLGLAWFMDLGPESSTGQPIAVNGVLYFATGYSLIHAVDAATGKLLWQYDPKAAKAAGLNLRVGWGIRGIAWWDGKIYTGTQDGRLIALSARDGNLLWSVQTFDPSSARYISGAPRVFAGKVVIGHGGDSGVIRGYVTAYDASTGKQLWRFYTVPGNPAKGFENAAMRFAARSWFGEWWKYGGGGTVWNAMAYDATSNTLYIGTDNGYPYNHKVRSAGRGDNLFTCSIVALDGSTGRYRWHYQINPGDSWDFSAAMDMELADLMIDGKSRRVLMTAPKNGFFYVIDRMTGKLISAEPIAKETWAKHIDLSSGRPVENPEARYPNGTSFEFWPSSLGAHSWMPMAYSPRLQLAYVPVIELGENVSDAGVDLENWRPPTDRSVDGAMTISVAAIQDPRQGSGALLAWNPVTQSEAWRVPQPTLANGGVLATAGNLVFQGTVEGQFRAYDAENGRPLWSFPTQTPMIGAPITYAVKGKQYLTVLTGLGNTPGNFAAVFEKYGIDPRGQKRRVLTFAIDASTSLPLPATSTLVIPPDSDFRADERGTKAGEALYNRHCSICHGYGAASGSHAPDLRRSAIPTSAEAFRAVVHDGASAVNGMPAFGEFTKENLEQLRQYLRTQSQGLRDGKRNTPSSVLP